jgi:hypothetical protein
MKVELFPLEGKYYGTQLQIKDGKEIVNFVVWHNASFKKETHEPSERELIKNCVTKKKWHENDMERDNHYESQYTYKLALKIKKKLEYEKI